jgi:hypothetical protein
MSEILNTNISLKENIKLLFSNLRYNESTHLGLGDIRLTIGLQDRIIRMIDEYEQSNNKQTEEQNEESTNRFI